MRAAAVIAFALAACSTPSSPVAVSGSTTTTVRIPVTDPAPRQTTTTVAPTTTAPAPEVLAAAAPQFKPEPHSLNSEPVNSSPGNCGGWRDLIAVYFPGEVDTACRVFIGCESMGDPNAVSPTDDWGLAQLNAPTWNRAGTGDPVADWIHAHWDSILDPATNLQGAKLIRDKYGWKSWRCY